MLDKTDKEVARLYSNGYKIKEIAERLNLSYYNAKYRLEKVRKEREVKRWWQ